ncbi:MAG: hypothetical protein HYW50_00220 [Candidatus Diapherotrites archaeon]|nr:hypothetical protein [Candidatus Diapherotrites archaeon]
MNSAVLTLGLVLILVLVAQDMVLFAVLVVVFLAALFLVEFLGKTGSTIKAPAAALAEDLKTDAQQVEEAQPVHPSREEVKNIYDQFVDFLVKENKGANTFLERISSGAEKLLSPAKKIEHAQGNREHKAAGGGHSAGHDESAHGHGTEKKGHKAHGGAHDGHANKTGHEPHKEGRH